MAPSKPGKKESGQLKLTGFLVPSQDRVTRSGALSPRSPLRRIAHNAHILPRSISDHVLTRTDTSSSESSVFMSKSASTSLVPDRELQRANVDTKKPPVSLFESSTDSPRALDSPLGSKLSSHMSVEQSLSHLMDIDDQKPQEESLSLLSKSRSTSSLLTSDTVLSSTTSLVDELKISSAPTTSGPKKDQIQDQAQEQAQKIATGRTWIETQTAHSLSTLEEPRQFFSGPRTEQEVRTFLSDIPLRSGWVHPLIPVFERHSGKTAILFILMCPKVHERMNFDEPAPNDDAFTHSLLLPIGEFIRSATGMPCIAIDFRKECRRKDEHCRALLEKEFGTLALATQVELLIAKNVYGIDFSATITWSKDVSAPGAGIDQLRQFQPSLLGHLERIPFHPRLWAQYGVEGEFSKICTATTMATFLFPVLERITRVDSDEIGHILGESWKDSKCRQLRTIVNGGETKGINISSIVDAVRTPEDVHRRTLNKPLLASWAVMAKSPLAKDFTRNGLLPTWYLQQPAKVRADYHIRSRRSRLSASEDTQCKSNLEGNKGTSSLLPAPPVLDVAMVPNPIFDEKAVMESDVFLLAPLFVGLVGSDSLKSKAGKSARDKARKAGFSEERRLEEKEKNKQYYENRLAKYGAVPGMRERTNQERRLKYAAKRDAKLASGK